MKFCATLSVQLLLILPMWIAYSEIGQPRYAKDDFRILTFATTEFLGNQCIINMDIVLGDEKFSLG